MAIKDRDPDNNPNTPPPALALDEIASEFGDTGSHSLSEFYRGGDNVPDTTTTVGTGTFSDEIINIPGSANSDPNVNFSCQNCLVNGFVVQAVTPYMLMKWGSDSFVWTNYALGGEIDRPDGFTYAIGSERTVVFLMQYVEDGSYVVSEDEYSIQAYSIKRKPTSTSTSTAVNTGIPKSGPISFSDMYSSANGGVTYTTIIDEDGNPILVPITEPPPSLGQRAPNEPTGLAITASETSLSVAFVAPSDVGSALGLSGYQYSVNNGTTYTAITQLVSPIVIPGLTAGTAYTVRLRATNVYVEENITYYGIGTASNAISVSTTAQASDPPTPPPAVTLYAPGAPTNLVVTAGDGKASISFTPPTSGTATIPAITNYQYFWAYNETVIVGGEGGSGSPASQSVILESGWVTLNPTDAVSPVNIPSTAAGDSPLVNGSLYEFRIRAVNSVGAGASSAKVGGTPKPGGTVVSVISRKVTIDAVDQSGGLGEPISDNFNGLPDTIFQTHPQDYQQGGALTWAPSSDARHPAVSSNAARIPHPNKVRRNYAPRALFDVPFTNNWITIPSVTIKIRGFDANQEQLPGISWYPDLKCTVDNPGINIYYPDGSHAISTQTTTKFNASSNYLSVTLPSVTLNTTVKGIYTVKFSLSMTGEILSTYDDTYSNGQLVDYILLNYRRNNWQSPAFDIVVQNTDPS
mgnify:FL=1